MTGSPLNAPRGICFGPDGKLYLANHDGGNILSVSLSAQTTGSASQLASGLSGPWGIAFDNRGNLYVTNHAGNSVYRMPLTSQPGALPLSFGPISAFASLPSPAGMDADPSGYLYVADNVSNGIYRVNPLAESRQIGIGISYPTSIWADADGKFILTDTGRILKLGSDNVLSVYAEGVTGAKGLVRDAQGFFYTNQAALGALTQIRPNGSLGMVLDNLGSAYASELQLRNDTLYLRANTSLDPPDAPYSGQGEVLAYNLANLAAGPSRLRTILRRANAIARDESGGPYHQYYYLLGHDEGCIWRVQRLSSTGATITRVLKDPARLKDAQDIHVDGSGRIWVADYQGPSGNGSLIVYNASGTFLAEYETVNKPTNFASDANRDDLWVNSHVAGGDLRQIKVADGSVTRTIGGLSYPRGFAFSADRTTLYVNEWGLDRISRLVGYQGASTPFTSFFGTGDVYDIETTSDGALLTTNGSRLRRIEADGVTVNDTVRSHYYNLIKTFKQSDGDLVYVSDPGWVHLMAYGSYTCFTAGLHAGNGRGDFGEPRGSGLVTNAKFFSYGRAGAWTVVTEQALDGSLLRTARIETDFGGMTSNGTDTAYFTRMGYGTVYKMKDGSLTTLSDSPFGYSDNSYGLAYHGGKLYQTNRGRHRIDEIDATSGARTQLKVGLVAPEL
ncbi:Serine/threonine-protein kinase PknD [compost metagenome]